MYIKTIIKLASKPWVTLLIVIGGIGGIIGLYFIYSKVDSGLKRPTNVSIGKDGNEAYFDNDRLKTARGSVDSMASTVVTGGKRKRKLRKKQRR
jgi:hypothetical protein